MSLSALIEDPHQLLQQLIVGEVLYKYYGGLNFEGITGGRHRRYFWLRPNTKVIYWHRENPQFFTNFTPAARSITLGTVEEISDRNPLPTALYHRSIVIHGRERDIKITCPTQARHQVWLAALQYIAQKD